MSRLTERLLDTFVKGLGDAHQREAVNGHRGAVGDRGNGLLNGR
jgi:hypothetical protein